MRTEYARSPPRDIHIHVNIYINTYMYTACIYIYIYICIYIYIYMYTHYIAQHSFSEPGGERYCDCYNYSLLLLVLLVFSVVLVPNI